MTLRHGGLWAGAVLLAVLLRLPGLGAAPLSSAEAAGAWTAWTAARGETEAPVAAPGRETSPALMSLQWLLFGMGADGECVARLPAALAGVGLVGVPWLLRRQLGELAAVGLAFLVAADPVLVACSRRGEGASLTIFLAALLAAAGWRSAADAADHTRACRWGFLASVCTGLLLASGPEFWGFAPLLLLLARWPAPVLHGTASSFRPGIAAGAALLAASGGLGAIEIASGMSAGLEGWLQSWWTPARDVTASASVALWSQPALLALAAAGLLWSARPGGREAAALALAAVWGLANARLAPAPEGGLVLTFVLLGAAAHGLVRLAAAPRGVWRPTLAALAVLVVLQAAGAARRAFADGDRDRGLSLLASEVGRIARARVGDVHLQPVEVATTAGPEALLRWVLREIPGLRFVTTPDGQALDAPVRPLLITSDRAVPGPGLVGTVYPIGAGLSARRLVLWVPIER